MFTDEALIFARGYWDDKDLEIAQTNPRKFIREIANPFIRGLRKNGKAYPIFLSVDDDIDAFVEGTVIQVIKNPR